MGTRIEGSTLFLAALAGAGAAGVAFVIGGACGIRCRDTPGTGAAYMLAGLALIILAGAAIAGGWETGTTPYAQQCGPVDPAAGLIGPLLDEAVAITKAAC